MNRAGISFLILAASTALLTTAQSAVLYNNSNITTGTGNGANGANTSTIAAANSSTYGFSANGVAATASLADDFSLSAASLVTSVVVDAYSTSTYPATPVSPFTGATVSIWNGQPGTAGAAVLFTSTTLATTAWTGVYRVTPTTLTNAARPVFSLSVSFNNVSLPAGTYWASYSVTGITTPGVSGSIFTPPVMNADGTQPTGNAIQSVDGGATWLITTDTTFGTTNRVPLLVNGTVVPEPTTVALLGVAGVAAAVAARRRRQAGA